MSTFEEHSVEYELRELWIQGKIEEINNHDEDRLINLLKEDLKDYDTKYILEEYDLASKIVEYYDKYKRLSEKQKYCICRAIAEIEYHYYETYDR